ncbi:hypothetical protein D3C80_1256190 [compost metagenome]
MRIKLRQRAARVLKIEFYVVQRTAQQDRLTITVGAMQEMRMRLHVEHVLDLLQFGNAHKLQRIRIPLLRVALDA